MAQLCLTTTQILVKTVQMGGILAQLSKIVGHALKVTVQLVT
jgi:hypothetical protein